MPDAVRAFNRATMRQILTIAGSDSGGGAGIQAELKTVTALGGYGGTAITVLTAQDTKSVAKIEPVSPDMVALQMCMMLDDIGVDCIKTGMLFSHDIISAVADDFASLTPRIPEIMASDVYTLRRVDLGAS